MRILLTGSKGQLGQCFKDRLPEDWELIAADSKTLDITDKNAVFNMVKNFQPDIIINAAAYTAVDKAESESEKVFNINSGAVAYLASAARAIQAKLIHISTDYIFDGQSQVPYDETSVPIPQNVYGQSKLASELLALSVNPDSLIIRTSWVFSEYGHNFVKTMLKIATEGNDIYVVNDQIGCPTYAGDLAQAIISIIQYPTFPRGIFNYCSKQSVSWYQFACAIFKTAQKKDATFKMPIIHAVNSDAYPTIAPRPTYSVLSTQKIETELNIPPADWQKALNTILTKI